MGWCRFYRRAQWDRERAKELESYLQIETDENIARGMSAAEARAASKKNWVTRSEFERRSIK